MIAFFKAVPITLKLDYGQDGSTVPVGEINCRSNKEPGSGALDGLSIFYIF